MANFLSIFLGFVCLVSIPSCGKWKSSGTQNKISGIVFASPVKNASVTLFSLDSTGARNEVLGSALTDSLGRFTITASVPSQPLEFGVSGGSYMEEVGNTSVPLGDEQLRLRIPQHNGEKALAITPLTHIAAVRSMVLMSQGASLSDSITTANTAMSQASGLSDITAAPVLPIYAIANGLTLNSFQVKYALVLAGLSQYATANSLSNSLQAMEVFNSDFSNDGRFDGNAWTSGMAEGMNTYRASSAGIAAGFGGVSAPTLTAIPTACTSGLTFCFPVCADLTSSSSHCGVCGNECLYANAFGVCTNSLCFLDTCFGGYASCDGDPNNGCEINLENDVYHCGMCGLICPTPPNSYASCSLGACGAVCISGFAACDGYANDENGCEINLNTNTSHCGTCGLACSNPTNATAGCSSGVCGIGSCNTGYGNCDANSANGCETNLNTSKTNCGSCGNACSNPTNATGGCTSGVCGIASCNTGYGNCDANSANGCETNLNTSKSNCGSCGNACASNKTCSAGKCV